MALAVCMEVEVRLTSCLHVGGAEVYYKDGDESGNERSQTEETHSLHDQTGWWWIVFLILYLFISWFQMFL